VKVYGLIEDMEVCLLDLPHISLIMNIVVIDVLDAWGMLLSRIWAATLGGFIIMDLTHAHIPMGDGTFDIIYNRQVVKKHVMDPNHPDYHINCEFDVPQQIIEYDPRDLPFEQKYCIDTLLSRTDKYKEKLVEFQGKVSGSIKILKKYEVNKGDEREQIIKDMVNVEPPKQLILKTYLMWILMKEALHLCGIRRTTSPSMIKGTKFYGLVLASLRRS
jgi:hypothetical protein